MLFVEKSTLRKRCLSVQNSDLGQCTPLFEYLCNLPYRGITVYLTASDRMYVIHDPKVKQLILECAYDAVDGQKQGGLI